MKRVNHLSCLILLGICWLTVLFGCGGQIDDALVKKVDSLNLKAYNTRYLDLDTTASYAQKAYDASADYPEGRAEALLNLAFVQYMLMDYDSASSLYLQSSELSKNIIVKSVADVGLMKICQITGRNDDFYDYRHDAELKLRRLAEAPVEMSPIHFTFFNYAQSEFHFASATYYNSIMQSKLALDEMDAVAERMDILFYDYAQMARYYILIGDYETGRELAMKYDLRYMLASASQHTASMMIHDSDPLYGDSVPPFALFIAEDALRLFREYGSIYSRATTYLTISDYYAQAGQLEVALDTATKALEFVNIQHMGIYGDDIDFLVPFSSREDVEPTEFKWLRNKNFSCAWEWVADIRHHLGNLFEMMGMQQAADYNNRIYWKILNDTRQDKRLEHQIEELEKEKADQTAWAWVVAVLSLLIFVAIFIYIKHLKRLTEKRYTADIDHVEATFRKWMERNEELYNSMAEEEKKIDSETYLHELHIAENKRSYIDKCTSLSLVYSIAPFLDRAINELNKLHTAKESKEVKRERVSYLSELIDRINLYNEVLSHWIKVRQGMVTLNIENFALQPLLDTLSRNRNSFANKGLTLDVSTTDAVVKADKALTLFMMNTLLDNARKYTPSGGKVGINVSEVDNYVEISVIDTGKGLSEEDIRTICQEKVYDSSQIGDVEHDAELKSNKGFGFGLMNCKGIIDKYRKSNAVFSVCLFNIESTLGKGSRFYFRLPKGVIRGLYMLLLFFSPCFISALSAQEVHQPDTALVLRLNQSKQQQVQKEKEYESLKQANMARQTFIIIALMLIIIGFVIFLVMYYRIHLLPVFNMRQLMQLNRQLFEKAQTDDLLTLIFKGINDIKAIDGMALGIMHNENSQLFIHTTDKCPIKEAVETVARHSFETGKELKMRDGQLRTYPLRVVYPSDNHQDVSLTSRQGECDSEDQGTLVGVMAIVFHNSSLSVEDEKILHLISDHLAQYIYYSGTKVERQQVELQLKGDERLRAEKEENTIHIGNMVLDNCLSAIKHETMYYPNRMRQLLDESTSKEQLPHKEQVEQLCELVNYYKEVFTLLSSCAARQLDNVMFKRKVIPVKDIAQYAQKSMKRQSRKLDVEIDFQVQTNSDLRMAGDYQMMEYLMDNLISASLYCKEDGVVSMNFDRYDEFVRITYSDHRVKKSEEELSRLFYPEHLKYDDQQDQLIGVEYLVCRQIVREHDEYGGRRGCRIMASTISDGYKMEIMLNSV